MALIVTAIRGALHEAGASEENARAAAGALADFEGRFNSVDRRIDGVVSRIDVLDVSLKAEIAASRSELKADIAAIKSEAVFVRFLLGLITTIVIAVFLKLFLR